MSEHNSSNGASPRVAVYFRMSRDVQDKSIPRQRSEVMPHCQRQGYRIVAEHQDEGISGSEVERRPGLQKVLALAKARQILVSELALAEKTNEDKAEALLDEILAS